VAGSSGGDENPAWVAGRQNSVTHVAKRSEDFQILLLQPEFVIAVHQGGFKPGLEFVDVRSV
jgi:hypothetical protein